MTQRYAVIGSNSFSGGHFVDRLLEDPENDVIGLSRSPEKNDLFLPYQQKKNRRFRFYQLDINKQIREIGEVFDSFQPSYVINFAAQGEVGTSWKYPEHWFETNAVGITKLCNILKEMKFLRRYVHISTPEVYGTTTGLITESAPLSPSSPYAASKAAGDLSILTFVKQYQLPAVFVRSTNVYGRHQQLYRIIPRTIIRLKKGEKVQLHGGGKAVKSYIHIRDVCEGIFFALRDGVNGDVYHLSTPEGISVRELVKKTCQMMGADFETVTEVVPDRLGQDSRYVIDSSKAKREFGWKPKISLEEGLKEMIEWIEGEWPRIQKEALDYMHIPS